MKTMFLGRFGARVSAELPCALLLLAGAASGQAAELPGPYVAALDFAANVMVGRITAVQDLPNQSEYQSHGNIAEWGRATIELDENLQGDGYTSNFLVQMGENNITRIAQTIPRIYRVGDSGVWIVSHDGFVSDTFGLLDARFRDEVVRTMRLLATRKWSEPLNGLRAWAVVVNPSPDYNQFRVVPDVMPNPAILFAVQNVSTTNIYVPAADGGSFVWAAVTAADGQSTNAVLSRNFSQRNWLFCRTLAPRGIIYLQPRPVMGPNLEFDPPVTKPGKYTVVLSCQNSNPAGQTGYGSPDTAVTAWTGELKAPPVELEVIPEDIRRKAAQDRLAAMPKFTNITVGPVVTNLIRLGTLRSNSFGGPDNSGY